MSIPRQVKTPSTGLTAEAPPAAHALGPPAQPPGQGPLGAEPALERRADVPGGAAHRGVADPAHHLQGVPAHHPGQGDHGQVQAGPAEDGLLPRLRHQHQPGHGQRSGERGLQVRGLAAAVAAAVLRAVRNQGSTH